jgi:tripartite-type tricarboxylate transporter receptor subunit TctC
MKRAVLASAFSALIAITAVSSGHAQSVADFYRGKTVDLVIGYSVGGAYDVYARLLARHIGKHIPGSPNVVPRNMEGAGSIRASNWMYAVAPKDGTVFGTVSRGVGTDTLLQTPGARFEADKFTWVGSANNEVAVCVAWHTSGIANYDDLTKKELIVGANGMGDATGQFPKAFNSVLNTKFKIVVGYPGGNDITLAIERGEVQGRCDWSWGGSVKPSRPTWIADKKINVLMQVALAKHPDLPDVPLAIDLAKNDEQRQVIRLLSARQVMGRPFIAPPGVPADRAAALQKAFMDAMSSKELQDEAQKMRLEINPVSGSDLATLVKDLYGTPADVVRKAAELLK